MNVSVLIAEYPRVFALIIVIAVVWFGWFVLWRAHRQRPDVFALTDSSLKALFLAVALTIGFVLWLDVRLDFALFDQETFIWAYFFVLVGRSVPTFRFLFAYYRGDFGSHNARPGEAMRR